MDIWLIIATAVANIVALALTYQFIKKMPKREIIIFLAISVATMYILISIVYWISGFGIDSTIHEAVKNFVTYLFVPINVILFVPYFALQYRKFKNKQIKAQELSKKLSTLVILLIIVLIVEYFYFVNIQKNVKNIGENKTNTTIQNEQMLENTNNNEETLNTIDNKTNNNEEKVNENESTINEIHTNIISTNQI